MKYRHTVGALKAGMDMDALAAINRHRHTVSKKRLRLGGEKPTVELLKRYTEEVGGCWEWRYTMNGGRGPQISIDGRMRYVRRVMYEVASGQVVPKGMVVLRRCDNYACVNPAHLFLSDVKENVARTIGAPEVRKLAVERSRDALATKRLERFERNEKLRRYEPKTRKVMTELEVLGITGVDI